MSDLNLQKIILSKLDSIEAKCNNTSKDVAVVREQIEGAGGLTKQIEHARIEHAKRVTFVDAQLEDLKRTKWTLMGFAAGISFAIHWIMEWLKGGHK